ncbi:MAG: PEP-CTERM sorting domain-containing protein [Pedosphaera sp.]|nr:PEP-CTERM sorting domain-containing protein [Pedosphaera sp.]
MTNLKHLLAGRATVTLAALRAAAVTTTGIYDHPSNNTNQVDQDAHFFSGTGGANAANVISVGAFTPQMLAAFNSDLGGVFTFDNVAVNANVTTVSLSYGTVQSKSLTLGQGSPGTLTSVNTIFSEPISSDQVGVKNISAFTPDFTFVFSSFANNFGAPDLGVTEFGFTFLSQGISSPVNYGLLKATASFSGGGTVTAAAVVNTTRTNGDTFYGFSAPAGQTITQVTMPVGVTGDAFIDDVGFTTQAATPEPTTVALVAVGAIGFFVSRRRRNG